MGPKLSLEEPRSEAEKVHIEDSEVIAEVRY